MTMPVQTKEVQATFGPKQMSREDFVKRWKSAAMDFYSIVDSPEEYKEVQAFISNVACMAGNKWDNLR